MIYSAEDRTCWHCRRALQPVEQAFGPLPGPGWEELFTSSDGQPHPVPAGPVVSWPIPAGVPRRHRAGVPGDGSSDGGGDGGAEDLGL